MKNIKLIIKIISPPIVCILGLNLIFGEIYLYPLLFGSVLGLFNWNLHRYKPIIGITFSIIVSYTIFFITYFSWGSINNFIEFILKSTGNRFYGKESIILITFVVFFFIIAPLLVFYAYRFVFNIPKTKLTKLIVVLSLIIIFSYSFFYLYLANSSSIDSLTNLYIWQSVIALGLQLILYQKEVKKIYKNK